LALFTAGFALMPNTSYGTPARVIVAAGGLMSAGAAYAFIYNLWRTIDGRPQLRANTPIVAVPLARAEPRRRATS
jgi:hypothetical protein